MRTLGIDLAVKAAHKAIVMDANGKFVSPVLSFHSRWDDLQQLVARAREGGEPDQPLQAVMEPTARRVWGHGPYVVRSNEMW